MRVGSMALVFLLGTAAFGASSIPLPFGNMQDGISPQWQIQEFRGTSPTHYELVEEEGTLVLQANSRNQASGLVHEVDIDLATYPILQWRWKVENIIPDGNALTKAGDDYAARVYVVFPHWFRPNTKSINYIWANHLPQGQVVPNPFFSNARMVAVQSGNQHAGTWITQCRNVYQDYREIFGSIPPKAGAIALMTDTDNTGSQARAWYADIRLLAADSHADPQEYCP
ncbi:DUF3047 domain-containing protein [Desulfurispirillum indicum]|uniref:DUF3047 domain-containing protein n=1 Tax=Desulfurispirillum indicum TaxID=936456 RepID=UPI001CF946BC|nr:DUF3047 domain-containing protein [Desulfurispirillum indicum]UCZ56985.1 DUF3047 domain-containing protein [Desulfurispirillum indicum]